MGRKFLDSTFVKIYLFVYLVFGAMGNCTAIIVVLTQLEHEHFRNTNAYDFLSKYFDQIIENDF